MGETAKGSSPGRLMQTEPLQNFGARNINNRRFYVTGQTIMPNGRVINWDDWKHEYVEPGTVIQYTPTSAKITYHTCVDIQTIG